LVNDSEVIIDGGKDGMKLDQITRSDAFGGLLHFSVYVQGGKE